MVRATQRQIDYLRDLGIGFDPETLTKANASSLIERAAPASRAPTQRQIDYLRDLGIGFDPETLTKANASALIETSKPELATPQQKTRLQTHGIMFDPATLTKADASDRISRVPATERQKQYLLRRNVNSFEHLTMGTATKLIDEHKHGR